MADSTVKYLTASYDEEISVKIFYHGKKRLVTIPKIFADRLDLKQETTLLKARLANGEIILRPVRKVSTLEDL